MRVFDVYIAVDWSARSQPSPAKPSKDALWVGEIAAELTDDLSIVRETYWRTRSACTSHLRNRLVHHVRQNRRVFIGFDFAYGYPEGYANALGLSGAPAWRLVWDEFTRLVEDGPDNANNRFQVAAALNARCGGTSPGPLWGCPAGVDLASLKPTSPRFPYAVPGATAIDCWRRVDKRERGIQPIWKLCYSGSVGGQTLLGIPAVCRLRDDPELAKVSRVWPFETGFTREPTPAHSPFVLHAEIWPNVVNSRLDPNINIKDQAQVRAMVDWLRELDARGQLAALFDKPPGVSVGDLKACVDEEGWIVGGGTRQAHPPAQRQGVLNFST